MQFLLWLRLRHIGQRRPGYGAWQLADFASVDSLARMLTPGRGGHTRKQAVRAGQQLRCGIRRHLGPRG